MKALDTAKDPRILVVEDAIGRFGNIVRNRRLKVHLDYGTFANALKSLESTFYEVKYSYAEPGQLAELPATRKMVEEISRMGTTIESAVSSANYRPKTVGERLALSEFRYGVRTVEGLPRRLALPDDPAFAVDIIAVEVTQVSKVEGSDKLTLCRCTDAARIWTIVTNIQRIKPGTRLPAAVLPPTEMMGVVSEAMFLGGDPLPEDTTLGLLSAPPEAALNQARGQVMALIKRLA
ncbi:MAG: hypothetical protein DRO93_05455 [Candidatus Thorarchaeota archaeon]|nr:MAG: hypothetical protein DRO93_05455 [Candidatus Thorarchaeota archaeon]